MADNTQQQYQQLTLSNGNAAQNQVLDYYNQLMGQLSKNIPQVTYQNISVPDMPQMQQLQQPTNTLYGYYQTLNTPDTLAGKFNYTLPEIKAPELAPLQTVQGVSTNAPQMLEYREIAAPAKITPQQIQIEEQNQEDLARQVSAYLRPYVDNAINARRTQTGRDRAAADVDATSRGMGASTWLSDAKNRMAAAEASDITAMENEYLGNVGQQAFNAYQAYLDRAKEVAMQNAILDFNAQNANAGYESSTTQFNERNRLDVGDTNIRNMMAWEDANANRRQQADVYNKQWANDRASEIGRYNFEAQQLNNQQAFNLLELAQRAAQFDITNQTDWALQGLNAYGADLDRQDAIDQYNTTAQNNALMAYWEALNNAAFTDAQNQMNLGLSDRDFYTKLMQLAMGYAGDLYATNPVVQTKTIEKDVGVDLMNDVPTKPTTTTNTKTTTTTPYTKKTTGSTSLTGSQNITQKVPALRID